MVRSVNGALACLCSIVVVGSASAQVPVYNSSGFEPGRFSTVTGAPPGNLIGQDSTAPGPLGASPNGWLRVPSTSTSTAVVQTATVSTGLQAVRVTRPADNTMTGGLPTADSYWAVLENVTAQSVHIQWDMNVTQATLQPFGPFFGITVFDQSSGPQKRVATFGVDAVTGEVLIQDSGTGLIDVTPTDTTVSRGAWHTYQMVLNYNGAGGGSYSLYVDDPLRLTPIFTSPTFIDSGINKLTTAAIATFTVDGAHINATGTAFFDNYSIDVTPVPEPSSIVLASMALAGLVYRRRRRMTRGAAEVVATSVVATELAD
jgi:hypothetical protein